MPNPSSELRQYKGDPAYPEGSIWVERRPASDFRAAVGPYNLNRQYGSEAMSVAAAIRSIHHRTAAEVGADQLARQIAQRQGIFYFAYRSHSLAPRQVGMRGLAAYAYLDIPSRFRWLTRVDELEVTQDLGTDASRHIGAALLHDVITQEGTRFVRVDGRAGITEGRSAEFFTDLGFRTHWQWGKPESYMSGASSDVLAHIAERYSIELPQASA